MTSQQQTTGEALAVIGAALDGIDHPQRKTLDDSARLRLVRAAGLVRRKVEALYAVLVGEADAVNSTMAAQGTPLTSWLALDGATSAKEASATVFTGRDLTAHPHTADQALSGRIGIPQARAIHRALTDLPTGLDTEVRDRVEQGLLDKAASTPVEELGSAAAEVLAEVSGQTPPIEDRLARLEAQRKQALARRGLSFHPDRRGSVTIRGSLPDLEASLVRRAIEALVEHARRVTRDEAGARTGGPRDRLDPLSQPITPDQRRADALVALASKAGAGVTVAGERPRIIVTMREADLRNLAEQAGLLDNATLISPGDLRRLCCDAAITPVVLGDRSEILDVGRTQRLVTPALRRALSLRDGGCVFPGCAAPDSRCDAHHILPWWAGGRTSLGDLVLLCPHHHALIEPARFWSKTGPPPDRWQIRLDQQGQAEFIPPRRMDPSQTPIPGRSSPACAPAA